MSRTLMFHVVLASILGCASEMPSRTARLDPSNPNAAEAPPPLLPRALADEMEEAPRAQGEVPTAQLPHEAGTTATGAADADTSETGAADAGSTVFTCPMHPEVRRSQPGSCPKCGMKLVPTEPQTGANDQEAGKHGAHERSGHPGNAPHQAGGHDGGSKE